MNLLHIHHLYCLFLPMSYLPIKSEFYGHKWTSLLLQCQDQTQGLASSRKYRLLSGKEKMKEGLCTLISLGMSQSEHKTYQGKCMFLLYWALEMPGLALFRKRKGLLS